MHLTVALGECADWVAYLRLCVEAIETHHHVSQAHRHVQR